MANPYLKSLLALSTSATAQAKESEHVETSVNPSENKKNPLGLTDERYKWLQKVMDDLVKDTDLSKILAGVLTELHGFAADSPDINEEIEEKLLDQAYKLDDLLAYADLTPQFVNSGGLLMLRQFLEHHNENVQEVFAQCVLTFTENNPPAQHAVIESGLLKFILDQLQAGVSQKMALKYLGAVSGTARSNENAFKSFSDLCGPKIFASLVKGDNMIVAAKAARVLTSIAYTLQDSATFSKTLIPDICENYSSVAIRSRQDENTAELEYIRDFLDQFVPKELLNKSTQSLVNSGLRTELQYKDDANIQRLVNKYA